MKADEKTAGHPRISAIVQASNRDRPPEGGLLPAAQPYQSSNHAASHLSTAQLTSCTAPMAGMRSRSFCVTATRTVITLAAGPVMRTCSANGVQAGESWPLPC